jgi:hypothetical protein
MAFSKNYSKLRESHDFQEGEDVDLEDNASDATKYSSTIENMDKAELLPYRDDTDEPTSLSLAQQLRVNRFKISSDLWTWLRWAVIVLLQSTLILLVFLKQDNNTQPKGDLQEISGSDRYVETGSDINGLYKTCMHHRFCFITLKILSNLCSIVSHSYTFLKPEEDKYFPNITSNDNRMEIRRNWDMLMPRT